MLDLAGLALALVVRVGGLYQAVLLHDALRSAARAQLLGEARRSRCRGVRGAVTRDSRATAAAVPASHKTADCQVAALFQA